VGAKVIPLSLEPLLLVELPLLVATEGTIVSPGGRDKSILVVREFSLFIFPSGFLATKFRLIQWKIDFRWIFRMQIAVILRTQLFFFQSFN
jgi:hypothetical protein